MEAVYWLMWANGALWLGLGLYVAFLARNQKSLGERVRQWENGHGGR